MQITYEESGKAKVIDEKLTFLTSIIKRVELNANFPQDIPDVQLDNVECASLNLFAAVMNYLTKAIGYLSKSLGGKQWKSESTLTLIL